MSHGRMTGAFNRVNLLCLLISLTLLACTGDQTSSELAVESQQKLIDILAASEADANGAKAVLQVDSLLFARTVTTDTLWGWEEEWILEDSTELARLGLETMILRFEQNQLQMFSFVPVAAGAVSDTQALQINLLRVGLAPERLVQIDGGWVAIGSQGQEIEVGDNGTFYQFFEHRPGH